MTGQADPKAGAGAAADSGPATEAGSGAEAGSGPFEAAEAAGALDLLMSDAALGVLRRFLPSGSTLRFAVELGRRPATVARRGLSLTGELARIAAGRSAIAPPRRDRRFGDPAWSGNPVLARIVQAYLAWAGTAESLLADAKLDWRDNERVRFVLSNLIDAAAPSNNPLLSPVGLKAAIDTNYWVNNYLQGQPPPPFDILYWNADTTRLPAGVQRDFIRLALSNALTRPNEATMLGSPVDLGKVGTDCYLVAGIADHLCPWQSCYRSTQLLGGSTRFVLATSGHIASMVNPPANPKASFQTGPENPAGPRAWLQAAQTVRGSWWPDYSAWLAQRSGRRHASPRVLGGQDFPPLAPAPGSYVLER